MALLDEKATYHNLIASRSVPVREKERFVPKIIKQTDTEIILDYGQNIAGYVKMHLSDLTDGQSIVLQHGEALYEQGNFTMKNLVIDDSAENLQTVTYIAGNKQEADFSPIFSVFGFQYVKVTGYGVELKPENFIAVAVYSDMEETGSFNCSNKLVNRLVSNSLWSQKGNFLDVPTDCPTRDRSPWSGDSQIYATTATQFMNVYPFFEKWMSDLSVEQNGNGSVPITFPMTAAVHNETEQEKMLSTINHLSDKNIMKLVMKLTLGTKQTGGYADNSAGWGDTAVITPYIMYLCYGDCEILEKQYPVAKRLVEYMKKSAAVKSERYADKPWYLDKSDGAYIWDKGFHFGEWNDPGTTSDGALRYKKLFDNPDYTTATMFYFHSTKLLARMSAILGYREDKSKYTQLADNIKKVFNKYLVTDAGDIIDEPGAMVASFPAGMQASLVRALAFGLVDDDRKTLSAKLLAKRVVENGYRLNTGFLATPYLLSVLTE